MEKCRDTLRDALKTRNDDPRVYILLARALFELQDLAAAEENLQEARKLNSNLAEVDYWEGVFAQSASRWDQAYKGYFAAYTKEPGSLVYLGAMLESKLALGQAQETAKEAAARFSDFPRSVQLRLIAASSHLMLRQYRKAEELYQEGLDIDSSNIEAREGLAHALYLETKYRQAAPILQKLITGPSAGRTDLSYMLGNCYLGMQNYSSAIQAYEACLEKDSLQPNVRLNLAKARLLNDQADKAEQELRAVLKQQPENAQAWELLGHAYVREKNYDLALEAYQQAIQKGTDRSKLESFLNLCSGVKP